MLPVVPKTNGYHYTLHVHDLMYYYTNLEFFHEEPPESILYMKKQLTDTCLLRNYFLFYFFKYSYNVTSIINVHMHELKDYTIVLLFYVFVFSLIQYIARVSRRKHKSMIKRQVFYNKSCGTAS